MGLRIVLGILSALAAVAVFVGALRDKTRSDPPRASIRSRDESTVLRLDIEPQPGVDTTRPRWIARYGPSSRAAEFEIELQIAEPVAPSPFARGAVIGEEKYTRRMTSHGVHEALA